MILKSTLAVVSLVVSGLALAGIEIGAPLVSGQVATFQDRHETRRTPLSQAELQALSQWLEMHRHGWHGMLTEATSEPPVLAIDLKDANGRTGSITVVAGLHGNYLHFVSSSEKWSYRSFGGFVRAWAGNRELRPDDLLQLQRAVGLRATP